MRARLAAAAVTAAVALLASPAMAQSPFWKNEFPLTDFSLSAITDWSEIREGGPGRDGIPALSDPGFIAVAEEDRLAPREPVIALERQGEAARAYPVRYLIWHEIVNDTIGELPVAVTFCPLCNSAMVFDRRVGTEVLSFGVTGKLRKSDMVMYDHESESWWQQALGRGIVGAHTGVVLVQLPAWMESWESFRNRNPGGLVMDQPAARRDYGRNPYQGYDSAERPFLYQGDMPPHGILPLERVVRVGNRAWPLTRLAAAGEIREAGVVISWTAGLASALDGREIGTSRDVGAIRVRDETGKDLAHDIPFAFAFHAFHPEGEWMLGE